MKGKLILAAVLAVAVCAPAAQAFDAPTKALGLKYIAAAKTLNRCQTMVACAHAMATGVTTMNLIAARTTKRIKDGTINVGCAKPLVNFLATARANLKLVTRFEGAPTEANVQAVVASMIKVANTVIPLAGRC